MARKPRVGTIYRRGEVWWIKYYRSGRPFYESSRSDKYDDAERLLKRRQGEIVTGKFAGLEPERVRIVQLLEELIEDYRDREIRSLGKCECRIRKNLIPTLGEVRAAEFGTHHVKAYIRKRRREKVANATINRELELLQRAFRLGYEAEPQLVVRVPRIEMLAERNVREGILSHSSYLAARDEFPEPYRLLLVVGYHTGARMGELLQICWSQVDLPRGEIRLATGTTKNERARVLPIYGEMRGWLEMARDTRDPKCPYLFQIRGKRAVFNWRRWSGLCDTAGLAGLRFHDLRRTALTNMVRAGIPEKVAMEVSGHRTRRTFERYNIVSGRDVQEVGQKMENYLSTVTVSVTVPVTGGRKLLN